MKTCCTCKAPKPEDEFGRLSTTKDGFQKRCKECSRASSSAYYHANKDKASAATAKWRSVNKDKVKKDYAAWRAQNPDKVKGYRRTATLKGNYGLTIAEYESRASEGCAICKTTEGVLQVDHDHQCCSGTRTCGNCIRGMLCGKCNTGLAMFRDNPLLLQSAILYLDPS